MKRLLYLLLMMCIAVSACSKNNNGGNTPQPDNSLQGPIQKPVSGYGSDGNYEVAEIDFDNPQYAGTQVSIFYPKGITSPKPTIFFSHPFGGENKAYNIGLYNFIAKKGYVVVFVPYRTVDISIDHRYQTLWEGFMKAAMAYPNIIDTRKVGFMGHSFGGGASIDLAYKAFTEKGWGQDARFLFTMAPWYSFNWNSPFTIEQQLRSFPANTKMIAQVYDEDDVNDHRLSIDIYKHINIPDSEKDFIYIKSSTINGYNYVTDHVTPSSRKAYDALDYYGVYRLLDAMMDYCFNGNANAKNVALGNGSTAQITMPSYNGQSMTPLEVTDNPTPKYPQSKYQFPCSSNANPRNNYCE
ncbi:alpha/beta hydrolase [Chitinophaga polysaccharea]|uniref:alpha/beta hydrolase n=1 Tax=Chitinophaga TaxID=79328 RepID=UPI001455CB31|nr:MULTISPECIES: alpha/beta hydrolase [Chitinophaga]NLR61790.1 alpha/beta hydrolase [Chitinophaga polysaccharea]NLU92659.1 alpha/beta hydrolase [Chitinophaga sp. Ak27]